jgi:hypothetical protein
VFCRTVVFVLALWADPWIMGAVSKVKTPKRKLHGEYAKHLRKYGKRKANKKLRKIHV